MGIDYAKKKKMGRPVEYDWIYWRDRYARGGETLEQLSRLPQAPSIQALKEKSSQENWPQHRLDFSSQVKTKLRENSVETEVEIKKRHLDLAKALQTIGRKTIQHKLKKIKEAEELGIDPPLLDPMETRMFISEGLKLERLILGESTENIKIEDAKRLADRIAEAVVKFVPQNKQLECIRFLRNEPYLDGLGGTELPNSQHQA